MKIQVDHENNSKVFWEYLHKNKENLPGEIQEIIDNGEVETTKARGKELETLCTNIPGWKDINAPEYAPVPLIFDYI